jgi:uracil phosphoribosyltransferase
MAAVRTIDHPLVRTHLTMLRDRATAPESFRRALYRLTFLLAYEATQDLDVRPRRVRTPLTEAAGFDLRQRIGLVPILRAGLGMTEPVLSLIPEAEIWHLGFYRNEDTLQPVPYYQKLPEARPVDVALVLDPMLATGGSSAAALDTVTRWGVRDIRLLSVLAAPEGLQAVQAAFPDASIFVCAIDEKLNDQGFIVPGLGDAGDRIFNTPP